MEKINLKSKFWQPNLYKRLITDYLWKAMSTDPKTLPLVSERQETINVFSGSAGKAVNKDIFFLG